MVFHTCVANNREFEFFYFSLLFVCLFVASSKILLILFWLFFKGVPPIHQNKHGLSDKLDTQVFWTRKGKSRTLPYFLIFHFCCWIWDNLYIDWTAPQTTTQHNPIFYFQTNKLSNKYCCVCWIEYIALNWKQFRKQQLIPMLKTALKMIKEVSNPYLFSNFLKTHAENKNSKKKQ